MSPLPPALKLLKQQVSAVMEGFFGDHTPIVVRPSMNHLVQFFDELSLWGMGVLLDEVLQFLDVSFDRLFAWGDDGLEAEPISPSICSGMGLSHRELPDGPAEEVKPYFPVFVNDI